MFDSKNNFKNKFFMLTLNFGNNLVFFRHAGEEFCMTAPYVSDFNALYVEYTEGTL